MFFKQLACFLFVLVSWVQATDTSPVANETEFSESSTLDQRDDSLTVATMPLSNDDGSQEVSPSTNAANEQNLTVHSETVTTALPVPKILSPPTQEITISTTIYNQLQEDSTTQSEPQVGTQHNMSDANTLPPTVPTTKLKENVAPETATELVVDTTATIPNKTSEDSGFITSSVGLNLSLADSPTVSSLADSLSSTTPETTNATVNAPSNTSTDGVLLLLESSAAVQSVSQPTDASTPSTALNSTSEVASLTLSSTAMINKTNVKSDPETTTSASLQMASQTTPHESSFVLQFAGNTRNCSTEKQSSDLEKQVRHILLDKAGVPTQKLSLNIVNCSKSFFMNVGVSKEYETTVAEFLQNLEFNSTKFKINDDDYHLIMLTTASPANSVAHRQPPQVVLSSRHTDIEFVIYVALGSACAFLLTLAVVLVTCKYCRTKPYKSFDLNDVSHLSHRLEDYSLRQIPRPKSVYVDYCRRLPAGSDHYSPLEEQTGKGLVHSFDTSVVPLEDVPIKLSEEDAIKSTTRTDEGQNVANSAKVLNHEYEEIDMKAVNSTENLQQPSQKAVSSHWGVDNDSFMT